MTNNAINLADISRWWTNGGGETKSGHFNMELYINFLKSYNERSGKK